MEQDLVRKHGQRNPGVTPSRQRCIVLVVRIGDRGVAATERITSCQQTLVPVRHLWGCDVSEVPCVALAPVTRVPAGGGWW